jgi:hypothetical protein
MFLRLSNFIILILICGHAMAQIQYGGGFNSTAQTAHLDMRKIAMITLLPHQKTIFSIEVKKAKNNLIIYNIISGKIIYRQKKGHGIFEFLTKDTAENLVIYDTIYDKKKLFVSYKPSNPLNGIIYFKENYRLNARSVKLIIKTYLLPMHLDTANKHFIRFLSVPSLLFSPNCSFSLGNIPQINYRTEPLAGDAPGEVNYHVDSNFYIRMKTYIQNSSDIVHSDTVGLTSSGFVEINIDFKHYGYVENRSMNKFISQMIEFLQHEIIPQKIYKQLQYMQRFDYGEGGK